MSDDPAAPAAAESTTMPAAAAPAIAPAPEIAAAAVPEAPAASAIDAESRAPSLLSSDPPAAAAPAAEPAAAAAGEPPAEAAPPAESQTQAEPETPAEPPAPEPLVYEKFAAPEGVELDGERLAPFVEILAPLQVPQDAAQRLVDLHVAEMQRYDEQARREQHRVFAETRRSWVGAFEADAELGGNRRDTTLANALWAINELGGDADQVRELKEVLSMTGAGDHPALIRLMHNAATRLRERGAPPPALPPQPGGGGRPEDRRYSNM